MWAYAQGKYFCCCKKLVDAGWDTKVLEPNAHIVVDIVVDIAFDVIKLLLW